MFKRVHCLVVAVAVGFLWTATTSAAQRTFVSAGSGSDANLCTRQLPCRNFAAAIAQTDPGGEVVALDSGGYGVVTINQSVALIAPEGVHAAITAFSTNNAIIIFGGATDVVIVRGLYMSGLGDGGSGIELVTGQTLHVENCVASGFISGSGVYAHAAGADVYVKDTISRGNQFGFQFESSGIRIRASLATVRAEENTIQGFGAGDNSLVTVTGGVAAGSSIGFRSLASTAVINLESCTTTMNGSGVQATAGTVRVRNSMITGNVTGVSNGVGASTISFGNNGLHGNTSSDGAFTSTVVQQ